MPVDVGRGGSGGQGGGAAMEAGNNWRKWVTEEFTNTFRAKLTPIDGLEINFDYSTRIDNTHRTYRYNEFEYLTTDRLTEETVGLNRDRKSTRLNSSHVAISYAVFCLKKKIHTGQDQRI